MNRIESRTVLCYRSRMQEANSLGPWARRFIQAFLLVFTVSFVAAQDTVPVTTPSVTSDPKALMRVAVQSNGLNGSGIHPWHLKATLQLFDDSGNPTVTGTYEELWAGPKKFRLTFVGKGWARTDYGTENGLLRSGDVPYVPDLFVAARNEFVEPLPNQESIERESFALNQIDSNGTKFSCLRMTTATFDPGLTYCVAIDQPMLRVSSYARQSIVVLHNRILDFQGQFIAGDLEFLKAGKPALTAHIESIELLDPKNEAVFVPPPDAKVVPRRINLSASVAEGLLSMRPAPLYPANARAAGIAGTVSLQALIGKDGHVSELRVLDGPRELQQAALNAVRTWVYKPYLLNGEPVEVNTTINIVFRLGK